jgi:hypothetical protein
MVNIYWIKVATCKIVCPQQLVGSLLYCRRGQTINFILLINDAMSSFYVCTWGFSYSLLSSKATLPSYLFLGSRSISSSYTFLGLHLPCLNTIVCIHTQFTIQFKFELVGVFLACHFPMEIMILGILPWKG